MEKIKHLMEQMGFSPELSSELLKTINEHIDGEKKKLDEDFGKKLKKAKEVCLQAVKEEKIRLARGVQLYLENKTDKIERARAQQMAIEESEAVNQLKNVKALLEGVDITKVDDSDGELQAAKRKISLLEHKVGRFASDRKQLNDKLRISNNIAARAQRKAMMLESKSKTEQNAKMISEGKRPEDGKGTGVSKKQTLNEAKSSRAPAKASQSSTTDKAMTPDSIADAMNG